MKPVAKNVLEQFFFDEVEDGTPKHIRENVLIDTSREEGFQFILTKEHLLRSSNDPRPLENNEKRSDHGLALRDWLANYKREAMFSTAGIRGPQNPLYPWDTRYPINLIGVMLATLGKVLVAKEKYEHIKLHKLVASEVRYNSKEYAQLIARIQAALEIETHITENYRPIPIWLASFLIFMLDLYGGEYVTSSHAISKKNATKDLNYQGSQYIPSESAEFIAKIEEIFKIIEKEGQYVVKIAPRQHKLIDDQLLGDLEEAIDLYASYLRNGIATEHNLNLIRRNTDKIIIECMGGSMYPTMDKLLTKLGIRQKFDFLRKEPDPFFHGIGKRIEHGKFVDYSCDSTIVLYDRDTGAYFLPVLETMRYEELLKEYPIGTVVLMADPDGDRLVTAQIEPEKNISRLDNLGILHLRLDNGRVLAVYLPNQSFLLTFDFHAKALKSANLWDNYNWFMIKTTPSSMSWDLWARANNVPVINVPVGFKEIASIMQKIEYKISKFRDEDIIIKDIFGKDINIGKNPRLLFAGEESGGAIFGPTELIMSKHGKKAIAMREKSAGESIVITSALASYLSNQQNMLSEYLEQVYTANDIHAHFDVRVEVKYYNENESNIVVLNKEKEAGLATRTKNDVFFLSIAFALQKGVITLKQSKDILQEALPELNFSNLRNVLFVGDGTYLEFTDKFVEVRPSGTDAVNKAYSTANSEEEAVKYTQAFANYSGKRNKLHKKLIPEDLFIRVKEHGLEVLKRFQSSGMPEQAYVPPEMFN